MHSISRRTAARTGSLATAAALTLGTLGAAAPAQADTTGFRDGRAMVNKVDIWRVRVVNEKMVRVKIRHDDITPQGSRGGSVFIDTVRSAPGPEFVFLAGLSEGTDYQIVRMENWKRKGGPMSCNIDLDLNYRTDVSHFKMTRECLDRPGRIRVAVKVGAERGRTGTWATDWLHGRRELTRWVARG